MWVTKRLISEVKKRIFCPKTTKFGPNFGIFGQFGPGYAGLFNALLVGQLLVVARGLYLARHLFTLFYYLLKWMSIIDPYLISINTIEIPCSWRMGLIDAVWHGTTCPRLSSGQISKMRWRTCCKIKI